MPTAADNVQTPEASRATAIAGDVACVGCGYNLRGLVGTARCPECGMDVAPSVEAHRKWRAPLQAPDGRWAAQIAEGAALALLSFVLLVVLCVAPGNALTLPRRDAPLVETPGRVVMLAVACAAWVTSWYSVWKLTTPAPPDDGLAPRRRAGVTRWLMTAYFVLPFMAGVAPGYAKYPLPSPLFVLLFVAPLAALSLFALMAGLFRRVGGGWARVGAVLLAIVVPPALFLSESAASLGYSRHDTRAASLDLLYAIPLSPYGVPDVLRDFTLALGGRDMPDGEYIALAAVAILAAVLHLVLLLKYLPYARERVIRVRRLAGNGERSGANSSP